MKPAKAITKATVESILPIVDEIAESIVILLKSDSDNTMPGNITWKLSDVIKVDQLTINIVGTILNPKKGILNADDKTRLKILVSNNLNTIYGKGWKISLTTVKGQYIVNIIVK